MQYGEMCTLTYYASLFYYPHLYLGTIILWQLFSILNVCTGNNVLYCIDILV